MKNFFLTKIIAFIGGRLDGYKTKIGGVGSILLGILGLMRIMFPAELSQVPDLGLDMSLGLISGGMVAIGIGGKLQKQITATETQNDILTRISDKPQG